MLAKWAKYIQEEKTVTVHDQGHQEFKCPPVYETDDIPVEVPQPLKLFEEGLFLTVYDEKIIIIPDVMISQVVDTLHESH